MTSPPLFPPLFDRDCPHIFCAFWVRERPPTSGAPVARPPARYSAVVGPTSIAVPPVDHSYRRSLGLGCRDGPREAAGAPPPWDDGGVDPPRPARRRRRAPPLPSRRWHRDCSQLRCRTADQGRRRNLSAGGPPTGDDTAAPTGIVIVAARPCLRPPRIELLGWVLGRRPGQWKPVVGAIVMFVRSSRYIWPHSGPAYIGQTPTYCTSFDAESTAVGRR